MTRWSEKQDRGWREFANQGAAWAQVSEDKERGLKEPYVYRFIQQEAGALGEKAGNSGDQHSGDETTQPSPSFPASAAREKFSPCCFDVRGADILPPCSESSPRTWQTTGLRKHCLSDSNFQ